MDWLNELGDASGSGGCSNIRGTDGRVRVPAGCISEVLKRYGIVLDLRLHIARLARMVSASIADVKGLGI